MKWAAKKEFLFLNIFYFVSFNVRDIIIVMYIKKKASPCMVEETSIRSIINQNDFGASEELYGLQFSLFFFSIGSSGKWRNDIIYRTCENPHNKFTCMQRGQWKSSSFSSFTEFIASFTDVLHFYRFFIWSRLVSVDILSQIKKYRCLRDRNFHDEKPSKVFCFWSSLLE